MNLSRYDHLLEQVNLKGLPSDRLIKCQEELTELTLALFHLMEDREVGDNVAEEIADVLLTVRSIIILLNNEDRVQKWLTFKANRLHTRILSGGPLP